MQLIELNIDNFCTKNIAECIINELKKRDLYRPGLIYSGFSKNLIEKVINYGSENYQDSFIYGNTEKYLEFEPDPFFVNPITYAKEGGVLAVYNPDCLENTDFMTYRFKDFKKKKNSLIAVFSINKDRENLKQKKDLVGSNKIF